MPELYILPVTYILFSINIIQYTYSTLHLIICIVWSKIPIPLMTSLQYLKKCFFHVLNL